MICPNCHEEASGKFCNHCGAPLPSDSTPIKKTNTLTNKNKSKKKSNHLTGTISKGVGKGVGKTISTTGSIAASGVKITWKLLFMLLQWICVGLMVLITWNLIEGFWAQRITLGSMSGVIRERNINQAAYLLSAVCIIGFGLLQIFWIATRKKMPDNGKTRFIDVGRGFFGFFMFVLLAFVARYINPYLPEHPYPLLGIKQVFQVIHDLGISFFLYNIAGIVLCIIRKF